MQAHKRQFERRVWGKNGNTHKNDGNDNAQTEYLPLPVNADSQSRLANYTAQGAIPKSRANAERGPIKSVNNVSGGKQQSTVTKQRQGDTRNTINKKAMDKNRVVKSEIQMVTSINIIKKQYGTKARVMKGQIKNRAHRRVHVHLNLLC